MMIGARNSVLSRVRERNPDVYDLGCICHLANLCAQAGIKSLPVPIEDLLIDVYFHFNHSAKRKEDYKEFLAFTDTDAQKIVKHCSTRWLSMQKCVGRTLQQWPALRSYFCSHKESEVPGRIQRCATRLSDHEFHLYYMFLDFFLPILNEFNTTFQSGASVIGYLQGQMTRLLKRLLGKFVKSQAIVSVNNITDVVYHDEQNQHDDTLLAVGLDTREYLKRNEDDIPPQVIFKFFRCVRVFYTKVVDKMLKKFLFKDQTLQKLVFLNPSNRQQASANDVSELSRRFLPAVPCSKVEDEASDYILSPDTDLPTFSDNCDLDEFWRAMGQQRLPNGRPMFGNLVKVSNAMLSIAHSNADSERSFSILRKIQTDWRQGLSNHTIHNIMSSKLNCNCACYEYDPPAAVVNAAKSACNL